MKKLLIASTALVLVAGAASADVTISGYGRVGLIYNSGNTGTTTKTQVTERLRFNIDASKTTDSGLAFGGRIRMQYDASNTNAGLNAGNIYVKSGGLKVDVGNVSDALDAMNTYYNAEVGLLGWGNPDTLNESSYYGYSSGAYPAGSKRMGIAATYSMGGLVARLSYITPDQTVKGTTAEKGISVDYKMGSLQVGAGYIADAAGVKNDKLSVVTAEYALGSANIGAAVGHASGSTKFTKYTVYGNTKMGATTVAAYITKSNLTGNDKTGAGVGASYDLGSGASLNGSIQHLINGKNFADMGVKFSF